MSNQPNFTLDQIYLAALLHDIGKFFQRADPHPASGSELLSPDIKALESQYCPTHREGGYYSHKHVLWTAQFFVNFSSTLGPLIQREGRASLDLVMRLAASHHNPEDNIFHRLLQKADHLASGVDRTRSSEAWKDAEEENDTNWDNFKRILLRPVFSSVIGNPGNSGSTSELSQWRLPLMECCISEKAFPFKASASDSSSPTADYASLWKEFVTEMEHLTQCLGVNATLRQFNENLLQLLEKYAWRIPSSTREFPDIPLYDHLKVTAALAVCLYKSWTQHPSPSEKGPDLAFIGGDLSGIQNYLYQIAGTEAAKNLKGRSFYLQLLMDAVVRFILDDPRLDLRDCCVLYATGGNFYILSPAYPELKNILADIQKTLSEKLYQYHGNALYLALDYVTFHHSELLSQEGAADSPLSRLWSHLFEKLSRQKSRRFAPLLKEHYDQFFEPRQAGADLDCLDGADLRDNDKVALDDDKEKFTSSYNKRIIELGRKLRNTHTIVIGKKGEVHHNITPDIIPLNLGYRVYLLQRGEGRSYTFDNAYVFRLNDTSVLRGDIQVNGVGLVYGFQFYGGNLFPTFSTPDATRADIKTFDRLCDTESRNENSEHDEKNFQRLGVLRMDVDNLGRIFKDGLPPHLRSLGRYVALSRSMDYFFKGYINHLWEHNENYRQHTQIIYAGGDDLLIVGCWQHVIRLAADIREHFRRWVCHHPALTLSGGMATVDPKFPILVAAEMAGDFEDEAKNYVYGTKNKNAFCFLKDYSVSREKASSLYYPVNWDEEFYYLQENKNEIYSLLMAHEEKDSLPMAFVRKVYTLFKMAGFHRSSQQDIAFVPANFSIYWLSAYYFTRLRSGDKNSSRNSFLEKWKKAIYENELPHMNNLNRLDASVYHPLQFLALSTLWAAYEKRSSRQ
jgi:CRISPR-associated protein Csm1